VRRLNRCLAYDGLGRGYEHSSLALGGVLRKGSANEGGYKEAVTHVDCVTGIEMSVVGCDFVL
jgi:hypothetical protein